jgi:hypothetical protein
MNRTGIREYSRRLRQKAGGGIEEYPGYSAQTGIAALRTYHRALSLQLKSFLQELEREGHLDMDRQLASIDDPQEQTSFFGWYTQQMESEAKQVQRFAWSTFVTLVCGNFDNSMDAFRLWVANRKSEKTRRWKQGIARIKEHIQFFEEKDLRMGSQVDIDYLSDLYLVRNAIAHANGAIDGLDKKRDREKLLDFVEKTAGLSREAEGFDKYGVIYVNESFASNALEATEAVLNKLDLVVEERYFAI